MPPRAKTKPSEPTDDANGASGSSAGPGGLRLVIVESPAKARTIAGYLGDGYLVESSIGHIRDLPRNAADVPAAVKSQPWSRLGVDVDNGFEPLYIVTADKKAQVAKLKALLKDATELYLATDEDREGEAIAWHLLQTLKPRVPVRRMVFHEITPQAIRQAVENPREIDERLVDAQETRRILDRLYGYEVSPVLWKKVMPKLSAGRVQSVATRILVEREKARMKFRAAGYWDIDGIFTATSDETIPLPATLVSVAGARVATGRDFDSTGNLTNAAARQLDETGARALVEGLTDAGFAVTGVEERPYRRSPYAPFMTSTLQQEAGRKLRFSSQRTMQIAQRLYENGYITYMRTDSTSLSETAISAARTQARQLYGPEYVPEKPRSYTRKVKNAQEAHEAIRPAGDAFRTPGQLGGQLNGDEFRMYELIWQRTVASQMADATGTSATVRLSAKVGSGPDAGSDAVFQASGKVITFPGFLRAYVEGSDDPDAELEDRERRLPPVHEGDRLSTRELTPRGHTTSPPARFTEASLVKMMEELGIGRPSTYATILGTIVDRGYAWRKGSALVPTWIAFAVVNLLEEHFGRLVDYQFTSSVEDDLDEIAAGSRDRAEWLTRFYFGSAEGREGGMARAGGLKLMVESRLADIDAREINSIPIGETPDGQPIMVRVGRYGPYISVGSGEDTARASVPEDLAPDELTVERALELLAQPSGDRDLGIDPGTGEPVTLKIGRYGPYIERGVPPEPAPAGAKNGKAKAAASTLTRASLFKDMDPATVTLDEVLPLLTLPRTLGTDPEKGEPVTAQNGRYGPYVKRGSESRSLATEPQLLTVTLDEALALLATPKLRGRAAAAPPLRELGDDPVSSKPMVIREGRFGPYVTDGETNASLRKGDSIEEITAARASELLADRRARGPAPAKARRTTRAPAKKATKAARARKS
ncbi:MAG TPA: type I DNA topoisomerase [Frankiaceae bacterium]|nr:type I DNA topoisomerase [Frankiaceae bacterium]